MNKIQIYKHNHCKKNSQYFIIRRKGTKIVKIYKNLNKNHIENQTNTLTDRRKDRQGLNK